MGQGTEAIKDKPGFENKFFFRSKDAQILADIHMSKSDLLGGAGQNFENDARAGRILLFFPTHQKDGLEKLRETWSNFGNICGCGMLSQPIEGVCDYLGCEVALYFAYLGLYTKWLVPAAVAGVACFATQMVFGDYDTQGTIVAFAAFTCLWSTLFLEAWKREQITRATNWGTTDCEETEGERPEFVEMLQEEAASEEAGVDLGAKGNRPNKWTNEPEWHYSSTTRRCKYIFTFGIPVLMMLIVCAIVASVFYLRYWLESNDYPGAAAGVVNGILIAIFNQISRFLSVKLTDMEHHRTDTEYSDSMIAESFLFQFVNNYGPFYMVAFIKANSEELGADNYLGYCKCRDFQSVTTGFAAELCVQADLYPVDNPKCVCGEPSCIDELAILLLTVFGVQITIGNAMEFLLPWFMNKLKLAQEEQGMEEGADVPDLTEAEFESKLDPYDKLESFDDYNEMVIQFGFIALFAPAFPLVALMGLCNNIIEIRSDANKLTQVFQRPLARKVEDIGSWELILELMTFIAVATNIGLLWFTSSFGKSYSSLHRVWGFLLSEHVVILVKCALAFAIPDIPEEVAERIKAQEFLTEKALVGTLSEHYNREDDKFFDENLQDNDEYGEKGDEKGAQLFPDEKEEKTESYTDSQDVDNDSDVVGVSAAPDSPEGEDKQLAPSAATPSDLGPG